jgi:hypothetical protein
MHSDSPCNCWQTLVMRRSGVQIPEAALWIWIVLRVSGNIRGTLLVESLACDYV